MRTDRRLLALAGASLIAAAAQAAPVADLLIEHGRVYPADGSGRFVQAVAVKDGLILATGTDAAIDKLRGPATKLIDAKGGAVVPGLIDTHTHLIEGAGTLEQLDVTGAKSGTELADKLRVYADAHPDLKIIEAFGYFAPGITRFDIDGVGGGRPIVVRNGDGHSTLCNSAALALAGVTEQARQGDSTVPRDAQGRHTGLLMEGAQALIEGALPKPNDAQRRHLLDLAMQAALSAGVTSAVVVGGQDDLHLFSEARADRTLKLRITFAQWLTRDDATSAFPHDFAFDEKDADKLDAIHKGFSDDPMLTFDMVKIMSDGVIESHTAAMLAPYADQPGNRGQENYSVADLDRIIAMMDRRGWQIMTHALGDRAVRMALDAYERAEASNPAPPAGRRHKIEHIEAIDPSDIPRFARLHVTASMQPDHAAGMTDPQRKERRWAYLGYLRSAWGWPWRSVKASGGRVAFGSDWPVAPLNIGPGSHVALTRLVNAPVPDQRLSMTEVIDGYTRDAAYSIFRDKDLGSLEPGKRADIVLFDRDIFAAVPEKDADLPVRATLMDGPVVYCADQGSGCGGR